MASPSLNIESIAPHAENEWIRHSRGFYACPVCKQDLEPSYDGLCCRSCPSVYPVLGGIPDFVVVNLEESRNRSQRVIGKNDSRLLLNLMAAAYESCVYPIVCNLYGGWRSTSLKQLAHDISEIIGSRDGIILDAACGPGTYGRRIASPSRTVIGVDISMSMLRRGARYVAKEHTPNVHFARATVETLPFRDAVFDAAICSGSLNHFSDTVIALREINRTMKPGASLAAMCFALIDSGLIKYKSIRNRAQKGGGHIDTVADLERMVAAAGFEDFRPHTYGSILVFSARKKQAPRRIEI